MLGLLQISHLTGTRFIPYNLVFILPNLCYIIHSIIYYFTNQYRILFLSIDDLIIIFSFLNFFSWAHYVYFCSEELCQILKIYRFKLNRREENNQLNKLNDINKEK